VSRSMPSLVHRLLPPLPPEQRARSKVVCRLKPQFPYFWLSVQCLDISPGSQYYVYCATNLVWSSSDSERCHPSPAPKASVYLTGHSARDGFIGYQLGMWALVVRRGAGTKIAMVMVSASLSQPHYHSYAFVNGIA